MVAYGPVSVNNNRIQTLSIVTKPPDRLAEGEFIMHLGGQHNLIRI